MFKTTLSRSIGILRSILLIFIAFITFHSSFAQNAIVTENQLAGTPSSVWDIPTADAGDLSIQGFGTDISANAGGTISFKINVNTGADKIFDITIYRIGYYQGNGARKIIDLGNFTGVKQTACSFDNTTGLTDCGNWSTTASWTVPSTAVSGLYIAKLTRDAASGGGTSHIPFIVRNDASTSKLFFKTSDATWQAYNGYGGYSLYVGAGMPYNHGDKVSYNRPFITRSGGGGGGAHEDWFMNAEYPMIRFLEANGYDISYTTDLDIARNNANSINLILQHKVFLSVGHDEYWSLEERNSVEAARTAGINLAFFSGNEVYWKTRWENSVDGTNTPYRTMVCYKEGTLPTPAENACGGKCDPDATVWTGLWRDGCNYPGVSDACKPENALSGEISWDGNTGAIQVPDTYKNLWFWRNTPDVSNLGAGNTYGMPNGTLGYEWDWEQYPETYPAGRVTMSNTFFDGHTHKLSLYKDAVSKALVFGAGTVQWSWGLDVNHDGNAQGGGGPPDQNMQQATINVLADMGAQPATIQSPLTIAAQSTDVTPPVTVITSPINGATILQTNVTTISGTATDVGGIVAWVEVSVDGGVTWQLATGTNNWTYSWAPAVLGSVTILSRAVDDIGNLEKPGGSEGSANTVNVTVISGPPPPVNCPCSFYTLHNNTNSPANGGSVQENDVQGPITVGTKFRAAYDGTISGIWFYSATNAPTNGGEIVQLWTLSPDGGVTPGDTLITDTLTSSLGAIQPGWHEVKFSTPVPIKANVVYIASYYSPTGDYTSTNNAFTSPYVNGPLTIIADGEQGANGCYDYGPYNPGPVYPNSGYDASNYWVDVDYTPANAGPDTIPPTVILNSPATNATNVNVNSALNITFSENVNQTTVTNTNFELQDASNNIIPSTVSYSVNTNSATLIPTSPLNYSAVYNVTVKGGTTGIKDLAGNNMVNDFTWSFTTAPVPAIPPDDGSGGPILIISSSLNPFSRYPVEILRAQGYTAFKAVDITEVESNPAMLNSYDVIILGQMVVTSTDVSLLSPWVTTGGTLIALRPSALLLPLMGVTVSGTITDNITNTYLLVNTAAGLPGSGIVNQTIQYHGNADQYIPLAGTTSLATFYSSATTPTIYPAITSASVGTNGGKAIAFAYDLASSIVYTRQGNYAWRGQSRDGQSGPTRSDNLFFPNYVDFSKIQIPQADEQQHLLTNIILLDNLHNKPLPHLWLLPSGFKAAVVMTGDDHNDGNYPGSSGTAGRFNEYIKLSGVNNDAQSIADWKAIRGTSYVYNGISMSDDSVAYYQSLGFEIALHPTTQCVNFTSTSLNSIMSNQLSQLEAQLPSMIPPVSNRTHCLPWSDWSSQPKIENSLGIRFDVNYYYWPASWVNKRPGMFTGSGMPMRFADFDGTLIDTYQAPTQMPDESGLDITGSINTLLNNATGPLGYYGAFVMNMHTDTALSVGSDEIIASAMSNGVPVISASQMLTWLDARNGTVFGPMTWSNNQLSFTLTTSAHNLQAMVPYNSATGTLIQVTQGGQNLNYTLQTIKGIKYGFFPAITNSYVATYSSSILPITLTSFTVTKQGDDALLNWSTSMEENNRGFEIQRSRDASSWSAIAFVAGAGNSQTERDYKYLDKNLPAGTYYYRLRQVDDDGNSTFSKIAQVIFDGGLALELKQNRPNPFNNSTIIDIVIPKAGRVQLMLYDQVGRPVQQLMDEEKIPGTYSIQVNRNGLSSGIYYYKMNALGQSIVRKMTIL